MMWSSVLSLIGTSTVAALVASLVSHFLAGRRDKQARERDATYLAIRLAVILEGYALACHELLSDNDLHSSSGGEAGKQRSKLPDLPPYPDDADWKSLETALASRALLFRNELWISDRSITFWLDIEPEYLLPTCNQEAAIRGYQAWCLAENLRDQYRIERFEPGFDVVAPLRERHDKAVARKKAEVAS